MRVTGSRLTLPHHANNTWPCWGSAVFQSSCWHHGSRVCCLPVSHLGTRVSFSQIKAMACSLCWTPLECAAGFSDSEQTLAVYRVDLGLSPTSQHMPGGPVEMAYSRTGFSHVFSVGEMLGDVRSITQATCPSRRGAQC